MMEFFFPAVAIKHHTYAEQALLQTEAHLDIINAHVVAFVCAPLSTFSELWDGRFWKDGEPPVVF